MSIEIDPCEDIAVIAPILKLLRGGFEEDMFQQRLTRALNNGYRCFVASNARGLLGYHVSYDVFWGKTLYIDDLVVEPNHRSAGIGAHLVEHAKREARALECDHIRLCSGLTRADAHRFYEQNGFAKSSLQFAYSFSESPS